MAQRIVTLNEYGEPVAVDFTAGCWKIIDAADREHVVEYGTKEEFRERGIRAAENLIGRIIRG